MGNNFSPFFKEGLKWYGFPLKDFTLEDTMLVRKAMEKQLSIKTTWENRPEGYNILSIAPESHLRFKKMRLHFRHPMYLYML